MVLLRSFASGSAREAVERTIVVDTLAQSKKLETMGLSREQAEELTQYMTEQIVLDRIRLSEKFSAKVDLEKVRMGRTATAVAAMCAGWLAQQQPCDWLHRALRPQR